MTLRLVASNTFPIQLEGEFTDVAGDALLDALRARIPRCRTARVIVDCAGVTAMDRGGAMALLDCQVASILRRETLALAGLTATCLPVLKDCGVLDVLDISGARELDGCPG